MPTRKSGFAVGDLVWAKMKNFPCWPAQIVQPPKDSKNSNNSFFVLFFGTKDYGWIPSESVFSYEENVEKFSKLKRPSQSFQLALKEIKTEFDKISTKDVSDSDVIVIQESPVAETQVVENEKQSSVTPDSQQKDEENETTGPSKVKKRKASNSFDSERKKGRVGKRNAKQPVKPVAKQNLPEIVEDEIADDKENLAKYDAKGTSEKKTSKKNEIQGSLKTKNSGPLDSNNQVKNLGLIGSWGCCERIISQCLSLSGNILLYSDRKIDVPSVQTVNSLEKLLSKSDVVFNFPLNGDNMLDRCNDRSVYSNIYACIDVNQLDDSVCEKISRKMIIFEVNYLDTCFTGETAEKVTKEHPVLMCSGSKEVYSKMHPLLSCIAEPEYIGEISVSTKFYIALTALSGAVENIIAEFISFIRCQNVNTSCFIDIINKELLGEAHPGFGKGRGTDATEYYKALKSFFRKTGKVSIPSFATMFENLKAAMFSN